MSAPGRTAPAAATPPTDPPPPPAPVDDDRLRRWEWVVLFLLLALATLVRVPHLNVEPFWLDELYSLQLSRGHGYDHFALPLNTVLHDPPDLTTLDDTAPWWHIWPKQANDVHPPLYFILLRFWREAFGESHAAARALSVTASVASVGLIYLLARQTIGRAPAVWAGAIAATAGPMVGFAVEARGYALAVMSSVATAVAVLGIERRGPAFWRLALVTLGLLGMGLTHSFTAGPAFAIAAYVLVRFRGRARAATLAAFAAAAVIFAAAWGPFFVHHIAFSQGMISLKEPPQGHVWSVLGRLATMPLQMLSAGIMASSVPAARLAAVVFVLPLLLLRRNPRLLLPALWLWAGVAVPTILDLARSTSHLLYLRYVIFAAPGAYLLFPALLSMARNRFIRHLPPAVALFYCLLTLDGAAAKFNENWREIPQWMTKKGARPGDAVVLISGNHHDWELQPATLYLAVRHFQENPRLDYVLLYDFADENLTAKLKPYERVWVVSGWPVTGPGGLLPGLEPVDALRLDRIGSAYLFRHPQPAAR